MATFTIDSDNNITALAGLPAGADQSQSFSTAKELAKLTSEWPASRLVDTWNSFAGVAPFDELKSVKKFTNRKAAIARIWQAVARLSTQNGTPCIGGSSPSFTRTSLARRTGPFLSSKDT